jgi:hypothetical protein
VPDVDDLVLPLAGGDDARVALRVDLEHFLVGRVEQLLLLGRDDHVVDADRDPGGRRGREAERLQVVQHLDGHLFAERQVDVAHEVGQAALLQVPVDEGDDVGERPVEEHPTDGRVDQGPFDVLDFRVGDVLVVVLRRQIDVPARVAHPDRRVRRDLAPLVRQDHFIEVREDAPFPLRVRPRFGQVVDPEDQILRRHG